MMENMACSIKAGPNQLKSIHALLLEAVRGPRLGGICVRACVRVCVCVCLSFFQGKILLHTRRLLTGTARLIVVALECR